MRFIVLGLIATSVAACSQAPGPYEWVDWTEADRISAGGEAAGVSVSFSGRLDGNTVTDDANANYTNYFATVPETFEHEEVGEGPATVDVLRMTGGPRTGRQVVTFSRSVKDPVFAVLSLGATTAGARFVFEQDVELLKSGAGHWGGAPEGSLRVEEDGKTVFGQEGYGLVRIPGAHKEIAFTTPNYETDYGFQLAVR